MPSFSQFSKDQLATCDQRLQDLFNEVIKYYDCRVECGFRDQSDQELAFSQGNTTKHWPDSKHNTNPSQAVDVNPWPFRWSRERESIYFAGFVMGIAQKMGISIRWGGDWNQDHDLQNQTLNDYPHFEVI